MKRKYVFIVSGVVVLYLLRGTLAINVSESLPMGIFVQAGTADLNRGDLVLFHNERADSLGNLRGYTRKGSLLGKRIAALPGDHLIAGERVFVNGKPLSGPARKRDSQGRPMQRYRYSGVVPQGMVFVLGDTPGSFDSRYYGLIRTTDITNTLHPIWTWK